MKKLFKFKDSRNKALAYTLAEIIIVLGLLGIVAESTIPTLIGNVMTQVFAQSADLAEKKIHEAMNQMRSNDVLDAYSSTDLFADQFQKYMKVTKRCTSANLIDCFPPKIKNESGVVIDISSLLTGADLGKSTYTSSNVGLQLANGTALIMAFDPACPRYNPYENIANTTACLSMVYDTNGSGSPNKIGKDISLVNATISICDGVKLGALCIAASDTAYSPINTCSGGTAADKAYDPQGDANSNCANNYWAGAKKACAALGMRLPVGGVGDNELNTIYTNRATISGLNLAAYYWSATEDGTSWVMYNNFSNGNQRSLNKNVPINVRCVK